MPKQQRCLVSSFAWARAVPPQDPGDCGLGPGPMRDGTGWGLGVGVGCLGKVGQDGGHRAAPGGMWQPPNGAAWGECASEDRQRRPL